MEEKIRIAFAGVFSKTNFPSASVETPFVVPLTTTFANGMGSLSSAEVTTPVIRSCAETVVTNNSAANKTKVCLSINRSFKS
ncbi:hypothetical protein SDC9_205167 [bioreactor metagenome]|uniref:Uncharacterized protein n=1 Tax=bioreactor metagenome TaxID=1076179 RepID=A0A645JD39_9ZZZZ